MPLPEIATFWSGPPMGWLHRLCVSSFAQQGHRVSIYTNKRNFAAPKGVEVRPMAEIWEPPESFIEKAHPVLLSDVFRLKLLEAREDVIWADADVYCLRPLSAEPTRLFGMRGGQAETAVMRLLPDDQALRGWLDFALGSGGSPLWLNKQRRRLAARLDGIDPYDRLIGLYNIRNGVLGPKAFTHFLGETGATSDAQPERKFYPVGPDEITKLFEPGSDALLKDENVSAVHFYYRAVVWAGLKAARNPLALKRGSFAGAVWSAAFKGSKIDGT